MIGSKTQVEQREKTRAPLNEHAQVELAFEQSAAVRPCKICGSDSTIFDVLDFARSVNAPSAPAAGVPVAYRRCTSCGFIFTRFFDDFTPDQWSEHVYNDRYAAVDPEFAEVRPRFNARMIQAYFGDLRDRAIGLDFGGGNGKAAAALREAGWAYDSYDPFGVDEVRAQHVGRYNLCTSFEVFEHLPDPVQSLRSILELATPRPLLIAIGTAVSDGHVDERHRLQRWAYAGPRNGHISLFCRRALHELAGRFGLDCHSVGTTHVMSRGYSGSRIAMRMHVGRARFAIRRRLG